MAVIKEYSTVVEERMEIVRCSCFEDALVRFHKTALSLVSALAVVQFILFPPRLFWHRRRKRELAEKSSNISVILAFLWDARASEWCHAISMEQFFKH